MTEDTGLPVEIERVREKVNIDEFRKIKNPSQYLFYGWKMLVYPYRSFVMRIVKAPLMKAIILASKLLEKKLGRTTRKNTTNPYTRVLLDIEERFFRHYCNPSRMELMKAAWHLFLSEIEHDRHYRWIFKWLIIEIKDEVNKGNWSLLLDKFPDEDCWKEKEA